MKTKKLFLVLFCLSALILGGCGGNSKSNKSDKTSSEGTSSESTSSESTSVHTHNFVFDKFIWTETPGAYTAVAHYVCAADSATEDHNATVTKDPSSVPQVCEEEHPKNVWKAEYDGHSETKEEGLSVIHHNWSLESWAWTDVTSAVAHFVCANDANHTHDETATGAAITEVINTPANCTTPGSATYTATVTFNGQNYSNDKVVNIPATGVHTKDTYGFCTSGGEYLGDTKPLNTDFEVDASGEYFFRVPIDTTQHYCFLIDGNNLQAVGEATAWIRVNDVMQEVGDLDAFKDEYELGQEHWPTMINIADEKGDGYLYVKMEEASNAGIQLIMSASNEHLLNQVGLCVGGDYYAGSPEDLETTINLGTEVSPGHYTMSTDDVAYYKFDAHAGHTYNLAKTHVNADEVTFYYQNVSTGEWIEAVRSAGSFTMPGAGLVSLDGYVYCVVSPMAELSDATIKLRLIGHPDGCEDEYGFCTNHDGFYTGDTISNNGMWSDIDIAQDKKGFFRFAVEVGHSYSFHDDSGEINYTWFAAYLRNPLTGAMTPVETSTHGDMINYTPVLESAGDGYLYLVVTAGGTINGGRIDTTTIHQYNQYGLCTAPDCNSFIGEHLADGETSDPFTIATGEKVYFYHEVEVDSDPNIGIQYSDSYFVTNPGTAFVVRNGQVVELTLNDAASTQDYEEWYMPTAQGGLQEGEFVYIIIENVEVATKTNWTITLTEC